MSDNIVLKITHNDNTSESINVKEELIKRSKVFNLSLSSTDDKEVCFPCQYNNIVNLYLMCLYQDKQINNYIASYPLTKDKYNLSKLLQLLHFLEDDITFEDPLSLIKTSYSSYKEVVDTLHHELQRDIYLKLPYCFTPFDDRCFFDYWIAFNNGKEITVENIIYCSYLRSYTGSIDVDDSRYSSSQMTQFISFKDGVNHGVEKVWYPPTSIAENNSNGKQLIAKIVNYNNDGKLHGIMKCWDINGVLRVEHNYDNGQKHGYCVNYDKNGNKKQEYHYHKGKLHGLKISYDESGNKVNESNYVNNLQHGLETWYDEYSNIIFECQYNAGKRHGVTRHLSSDGRLKSEYNYVDEKQHGISRCWYESGSLHKEENYCDGKLHGETKIWYEGNPNVLEKQCNYKHGKLHGMYRTWYPSGILQHVQNYNEDKLDGVSFSYYPSSNRCSSHTYYNGKKHGVLQEWYDDDQNQLKKEYHYENNVKRGACKEWYCDGKLRYCTYYDNGHTVKHK
jgi:antitoxin component YwqK of YwqJK toxin-antitoxin module